MIALPGTSRTSVHQAELIARRKLGRSLNRPFYLDPAMFDLDLLQVWRRQWIFAGHGNNLVKPGGYFRVIGHPEARVFLDEAAAA